MKMSKITVTLPPPSGEGTSFWPIDPPPTILLPFQWNPPDFNRVQVINRRVVLAIRLSGSLATPL